MRSTDCQRPPQPPTTHAQRSTALPLHRRDNTRVHAARRTHTSNQPRKQSHAALRSHTPATARRGAATHTRRHTSAIAILRYSTLLTALETRRQCTPNTRILHRRAYDAATILKFTFRRPDATSRTVPTSAALPATITPHNHARTDTHDATSPTHHNTTSASWRVSPETAHTNKPRTAHRTLTHSIQHTSPARPHDVPHSRNHCTPRKHHCTHTAAHTPHSTARHTAPRSPHTAHRKSHPVTHAASAPHSPYSWQAARR